MATPEARLLPSNRYGLEWDYYKPTEHVIFDLDMADSRAQFTQIDPDDAAFINPKSSNGLSYPEQFPGGKLVPEAVKVVISSGITLHDYKSLTATLRSSRQIFRQRRGVMTSRNWKIVPVLSALVLATTVVPHARAECGGLGKSIKPASFSLSANSGRMVRAAFDGDSDDASIVGMWHAVLTAHAMNGQAIPATVVDNSLTIWHSDHTDIIVSDRPPQDGQVCLGVWEQSGAREYKLNHISRLANDLTNAPTGIGNPTGPAQLTENVTISSDGNHYSGMFTLTAYDLSFKPLVTFTGNVSATRITTNTTIGDLK